MAWPGTSAGVIEYKKIAEKQDITNSMAARSGRSADWKVKCTAKQHISKNQILNSQHSYFTMPQAAS
jgi:hypothetical protein